MSRPLLNGAFEIRISLKNAIEFFAIPGSW
jgi:hypothetical protein